MASSIFRSVLNRSRASAGVLSSNVLTDIGVTLFQKQPAFMTKRTLSSNVPENLWKLGRLNHVAIATPNLSKSVTLYKDVMGASVRYIFFFIKMTLVTSTVYFNHHNNWIVVCNILER